MAGVPPLKGIRVLELAGLAPGPFAGMLLADAGASVLRIDRPPSGSELIAPDVLARHKASIVVDLKHPRGVALLRTLASHADVLIDPFRPGVLEKLGLGPESLGAANPRLVYARLSGFRRDGRYADMAGHDINYLAVSGALGLLGRAGERPHAPWNLLADFAGGGATLVHGVLLALVARSTSGRGQVVEANMVDGSAYLATFPRMTLKTPIGDGPRGTNLLDGGCPWYDTYQTRDAKHMAVGALEPQFFAALLRGLGLDHRGWEEHRADADRWPELRRLFTDVFRSKTRAEWEAVFDGTDACCTPVLEYAELATDPTREGDQRPAVTLSGTPCLAVKQGTTGIKGAAAQGQGPGVPGDGYEASILAPGEGGEDALREWVGWERGHDFDEHNGGLVLKQGGDSKL